MLTKKDTDRPNKMEYNQKRSEDSRNKASISRSKFAPRNDEEIIRAMNPTVRSVSKMPQHQDTRE